MDHKPTLDFFRNNEVPMLEIELGPKTPAHIGIQPLTFGIFDGFALAVLSYAPSHIQPLPQFQFIKLTYPTIDQIKECEYFQNLIRQYRFAGQINPGSELFAEDAAVCLGIAHDVTQTDFENSLKIGLAQMGRQPKHLHVYWDEDEFLAAMDGSIYAVCDTSGKWLCDVYTKQFQFLTDEGILIDSCEHLDHQMPAGAEANVILSDAIHRQYVYDRRIEILRLQ